MLQMALQLQGCAFGSKAMAERLMQMEHRQEITDLCEYLLELNM